MVIVLIEYLSVLIQNQSSSLGSSSDLTQQLLQKKIMAENVNISK
jgi:hypothetical protein